MVSTSGSSGMRGDDTVLRVKALSLRRNHISSQFLPTLTSIFSGTSRSSEAGMIRSTISRRASISDAGAFEDELVVDLEEHLRAQAALRQLGVDAVHGDLDDVGGGALDGHVDGDALGGSADHGVVGVDLRHVASTAHERLGVAAGARLGDGSVAPLPDVRVALEVGVDEVLRLFAGDAFTLGEAEAGEAVEDAEVEDLRAASHLRRDSFERDAEDFGGRGGVDVDVLAERLE